MFVIDSPEYNRRARSLSMGAAAKPNVSQDKTNPEEGCHLELCCAQIYSPSRAPPVSMNTLEELVSLGITVTKGLGENVNPMYLRDIEDMKPCSGSVVQKGLQKLAVYVDEHGKKHACSAVCPHMKAVVQVTTLITCDDRMHILLCCGSVTVSPPGKQQCI